MIASPEAKSVWYKMYFPRLCLDVSKLSIYADSICVTGIVINKSAASIRMAVGLQFLQAPLPVLWLPGEGERSCFDGPVCIVPPVVCKMSIALLRSM